VPGRGKKPWHLFVDSDDNILVADSGNHCIKVFHQEGNHIKSIGTGNIVEPFGVCMDRNGRIFIGELGLNRISII